MQSTLFAGAVERSETSLHHVARDTHGEDLAAHLPASKTTAPDDLLSGQCGCQRHGRIRHRAGGGAGAGPRKPCTSRNRTCTCRRFRAFAAAPVA